MGSEFAQSRGDDDLFSDDFEPASIPTIVHDHGSTEMGQANGIHRYSQDAGDGRQTIRGRQLEAPRGNSRGRGRGRGFNGQGANRGRPGTNIGQTRGNGEEIGSHVPRASNEGSHDGGGRIAEESIRQGHGSVAARSGLAASRFAPQAREAPANVNTGAISTIQGATKQDTTTNDTGIEKDTYTSIPQTLQIPLDPTASSFSTMDPSISATATETTETLQPTDTTNTQPNTPTQPAAPRTTAVRGDRSATGGPKFTKLTETQLTEKMAKMAILNAQKAERFRLSEADSAAFAQKEAELHKKRAEEQKNARAMDMERAKNRERKLKAQGGREWDSEKQESDIMDRIRQRGSEYVRGGHGGAIRGGLEGYAVADKRYAGDEKGREYEYRQRGRGRGRGGGRGGKAATPSVPASEDFPALPGSASKSEALRSPIIGGDWADEVSGAVAEAKG
ncbi:hypothetical protein BJ878DRAFT_250249 [Calycina marina]|uniref:Uncharacterized protein n=1 Tax=Calycina marina TaxID=1763456 RepID=A0A9P7Z7T8_9HELO|nr:hypothetical protein BJ878DRAFT_250249 [Calycina marina]